MTCPKSSLQSHFSMLDLIDDDVLGVICELLQHTGADGATVNSSVYNRNKDLVVQLPFQKSPYDSLSRTSKRLRAHCLPHLFSKFTLHCCAREGLWEEGMAKLKDWNPEYSLYVREVSILFKRSPGIMSPPKDFVKELPDTLASILSRISSSSTRLSKMAFNTDQHTIHSFKKAFARAQHQHRDQRPGTGTTGTVLSLSFPTVICLTVGPYNEFIVQHCPNIRHISDVPHSVWGGNIGHAREHIMNLIEEARKIENLESFVIREALTEELMNALYSSIPRIKTLAILRHSILYMSFEDFVSTHLSRFRHLRILSIPDVSHLDVGYSPPQWGGFSPRPDADEIRKRIDEGKQARERVARAIFEACPLLKELWFEDRIRASVKAKGGTGVGDVEKAVNSNTRTRELAFSKGRNDCDCEPPTFMFLPMCADFS